MLLIGFEVLGLRDSEFVPAGFWVGSIGHLGFFGYTPWSQA